MMLVKSSLKYSPIHGVGCFTEEDIKQGQVVWRLDSRFDLEIKEEDFNKLPASYVHFFKMYCYGQQNGSQKTYILCGDHARHMNHTTTPNLLEGKDGTNVAARDIKAGEELTCDYNEFDTDASFKLGH